MSLLRNFQPSRLTVFDTKERPFCMPYVAKCRLLVHAHLEHIDIPDKGLHQGKSHDCHMTTNIIKLSQLHVQFCLNFISLDLDAILKYSPLLLNEMVSCLNQVWQFSKFSKQQKGRAGAKRKGPTGSIPSLSRLSLSPFYISVQVFLSPRLKCTRT